MSQTTSVLAVTLALGIALGLVGAHVAYAQQPADPRVADLVRAAKVRVGVGVVAPHWAVKDEATGELRGLAIDLARAFTTRLGVALVPVAYPSPPSILEGLKSNAWDVGFLAIDPSRATVVDFSHPYLEIDAAYLVPGGPSIRNVSDADQSGIRIAVTRNSVEEIVLSRMLKRAELRAAETISAGLELVRAGDADVLAAPRPALLQSSARIPDSRVLGDRFHAAFAAMAVPNGLAARLAYINGSSTTPRPRGRCNARSSARACGVFRWCPETLRELAEREASDVLPRHANIRINLTALRAARYPAR